MPLNPNKKSKVQDQQNTTSEKFWWTAKMLAIAGVTAGGLYLSWQAILPVLAALSQARARQGDFNPAFNTPEARFGGPNTGFCLPPYIEVETLSQNSLLSNAAPAFAMRDPSTGQSVTVWPELDPVSLVARLNGAAHDDLNFQTRPNTLISRLSTSVSEPTIVPNTKGYTLAWTGATGGSQQVYYQFINGNATLSDPLSVELPASSIGDNFNSAPSVTTLSNEKDFVTVFGTRYANANLMDTDYQLSTEQVINGVAQGTEILFTDTSFSSAGIPVYLYFKHPSLITQNNIQTVFYDSNLLGQHALPTYSNEIRYISSPGTVMNSDGVSITAANFGTANYQFAYPAALVLPGNSKVAVAYLGKLKTAPANNYNVYIQLLKNGSLALNGNPIQLPLVTAGNCAPVLVNTPYGFGVFTSVGNGTTTPPQAYFMGFNANGTVVVPPVQISPSTNAQSYVTGAVAANGNMIVRWRETVGSHYEIRGTVRTPQMQIVVPNGQAYTENVPFNLGFGLTTPISLPNGTSTQVTLSVPAGSGCLSISDLLPAPGNVTASPDNTQLTIQTSGATLSEALVNMNLNLGCVQYIPALNSNATVTVSVSAQLANAAPVNNTITLPGIHVYYPSVWAAEPSFSVGQGATIEITPSDFNATNVDEGVLVYTVSNVQHGSFISVPDRTLPMDYPGTVVTEFSQSDISNGLIRFRQDRTVVEPTFSVAIKGPGGITTAPVKGNVDLFLDPVPVINPSNLIVVNQGERLIFSAQSLNATDLGTGPEDLSYSILSQSNDLTFQYRASNTSAWINFPNPKAIQFTQEQINQGLISILQDGTTFARTGFSYQVADLLDFTSSAVNANLLMNPTPVWTANTVVFTELNRAKTLKSTEIAVQDGGPAIQVEITITQATGCTLSRGSVDLAIGDSFTQDEVNNGRIQITAQSDKPRLSLQAKDQYGAQASTQVDTSYQPNLAAVSGSQKNPLPTIIGTSISGASLLIGIGYKAYTIYKERQKSIRICPLGRLLRNELGLSGLNDFDSKEGIQFVQTVNAIDAQLAGQGVTYAALPYDRQELLAKKLAEYFESEQGSDYIVTKRSLESLKENHWVCTAYLTKCGDMVSSPKMLDHARVKSNAYSIASKVAELYRGALAEKSTHQIEMI